MFRKNLSLSIALGAVTALGVLAQPARAAIVNGGFEDLTDFNQQADFKTPPDGTKQAVLSNNPQAIPGDAGAVTNIPTLDTFFNLGAGALEARNVQSGSGIKQTFFANTGDVISFKYDFATNEAPTSETTRDFGFYTLQGPAGGDAAFTSLANPSVPLQSPTNPLDGINAYFNTESGYLTGTFNVTTPGNYTLAFGVANVGNTTNASGLLVDSVTGASTIPLPAAVYVMPLGLAVAGLYIRKMRRSVAC